MAISQDLPRAQLHLICLNKDFQFYILQFIGVGKENSVLYLTHYCSLLNSSDDA